MGLISGKIEALYAELNERLESATSSYFVTDNFLQFIYSVLVTKNHQKFMSCPSQIFFNDINHGTERQY